MKKLQTIMHGRRPLGHLWSNDRGVLFFMAEQHRRAMFCDGERTIAEAMLKGKAGWLLEEETLLEVRALGARAAGIKVKDTGELYLASIETWFDREKVKVTTFFGGSALKRALPIRHMRLKVARIKL